MGSTSAREAKATMGSTSAREADVTTATSPIAPAASRDGRASPSGT
jgi:hypothetical protein